MIGNLIFFLTVCVSTGLIIFVLSKIIKYVVLFSKFAFAVIGAAALCQFVTIVESNIFVNFIVIMIPLLGLCFLMNLFPRINFSITFLLNIFIITIIGTSVIQGVLPKIGSGLQMNKYVLLFIYLVCAIISFRVLMDQVQVKKDMKFFLLRFFDRLLASVLNTVSLFYIILQTINFPDNIPLFIAAIGVSIVLFYLADIFLFKWISPLATGRKMPSEIRHILEKDWSDSKIFSFSGDGSSWSISSMDNDNSMWDYDEQQRRNQALNESLWAAQREREAYEEYQKQVESANRYYDENY